MMSKSANYKLAKISALPSNQQPLFDTGEIKRAVTISRAILKNPSEQQEKEDLHTIGIFGAERLEEKPHIIGGKIAKGQQIPFRRVFQGEIAEMKLADHPYCNFYYSERTQIIAFQSARINKGFENFLKLLDRLLSREIAPYGLYVHIEPLRDSTQFVRRLKDAFRVETIWFHMIPPNAYTSDSGERLVRAASEGTRTRQVRLTLDSHPDMSLNPDAPIIQDLSAECGYGNGHCGARILASKEAKAEYIGTKSNHVIRHLTLEEVNQDGAIAIERMLSMEWAPED